MATRSVSLVDRLELEFQGSIYKNAISFGDVDGDGGNEVLICNTAGQLFIFKGRSTKPWRTCPGLGCVTVIIVGDVRNDGENVILSMNTEGQCFIFAQVTEDEDEKEETTKDLAKEKVLPSKPTKSSPVHNQAETIKPSYKQDLPTNPKMAILADVTGDGLNELVVCYTDRYVRIFKWESASHLSGITPESKSEKGDDDAPPGSVKKQEHKLAKQPSKDEDGRLPSTSFIKQPSKDSGTSGNPSPRSPTAESAAKKDREAKQVFNFDDISEGKFVMMEEFSLSGQVGSVAVLKLANGKQQLVASQPSGGYAVLAVYGDGGDSESNGLSNSEREDISTNKETQNASQPCVYYPANHHRLRNFKVDSEVLGSVRRNNEMSGLFCVCTVDGTYSVINNSGQGVNILPISSTTEHKWFAMDQLDIGMDGNDAIVLCSWDGMTYVIDKDFETISYSFGDNICGFRAGMYAIDPRVNVPCLGYVTFLNRLVLFYDVSGVGVKSRSLYDALLRKLQSNAKYDVILKHLQDPAGNIDINRLRKLVKSGLS